MLLAFFLILILMFAIMPSKKAIVVTKCLTSLFKTMPFHKVCETLIAYYNYRNKDKHHL